MVKIGFTTSLVDRLWSLQKGSPVPLVPLGFIRGDRDVEKFFHVRFTDIREYSEWFQETEELMAYAKQTLKPWPTERLLPDESWKKANELNYRDYLTMWRVTGRFRFSRCVEFAEENMMGLS